MQPISWPGCLFCGGDVPAAALDRQLDLSLPLPLRVARCNSGLCTSTSARRRDVAGGHLTGTLLAQVHGDRLVVLGGD